MQGREPDEFDRDPRGWNAFDKPGSETRLGRLAGKFTFAGVIATGYILLRPG